MVVVIIIIVAVVHVITPFPEMQKNPVPKRDEV